MRLVLCDDNRMLCEALASILEAHGHPILAITTCVAGGIAAVAEHRPDACLLDLCLPDGSGLDAARAMRHYHPDTKVLVLSCLTDPAVLWEAKKIGVTGFLRKDQKPEKILAALDVIGAGGTVFDPNLSRQPRWRTDAQPRENPLRALTPREMEVMGRIVAGQSTAQMAREMGVATSTLRSYIKNILTKLGAHTRLQAAAIASRAPRPLSGAICRDAEAPPMGRMQTRAAAHCYWRSSKVKLIVLVYHSTGPKGHLEPIEILIEGLAFVDGADAEVEEPAPPLGGKLDSLLHDRVGGEDITAALGSRRVLHVQHRASREQYGASDHLTVKPGDYQRDLIREAVMQHPDFIECMCGGYAMATAEVPFQYVPEGGNFSPVLVRGDALSQSPPA
jgi:DNA-binding NarL/FixJ family response regulator